MIGSTIYEFGRYAMKALGSEIKDFYANHFPAGHYHDDCDKDLCDANGEFTFTDSEMVDLQKLGVIVPEGEGNYREFSTVFTKWKKSVDRFSIVVSGPAKLHDEAVAKIKALGYAVKG